MKKSVVIIISSFFLTYCVDSKKDNTITKQKTVQSFLTYRTPNQKHIEIDIDSIQNFGELLNVIDTTDCRKLAPVFKIETDSTIYKIQHLHFCETIYDYKLRNILYVSTDSITVNEQLRFPIDNLHMVLKNHLINVLNDESYPIEDEERFISIHVDESEDIKEVKKLLLHIISVYTKLNIKTKFAFMFDRYGMIQVVTD